MKTQSIILMACVALLLSACSQENAQSPTPATVSAAALPSQPSEEARVIRDILLGLEKQKEQLQTQAQQIVQAAAQSKQPEKQAIVKLQSTLKTHLAQYQRDLATLQKLRPQDEFTQIMQADLIKRLETVISPTETFVRTGEWEKMQALQDLLKKQPDLTVEAMLPKQWRFEAQFVKQPEILLEAAALWEQIRKVQDLLQLDIPPVDKNLSKQEKLNVIADYLAQNSVNFETLERDFAQLTLTQPEMQALRDAHIGILQGARKKEAAIIQRLREGKTDKSHKTEQEKAAENQVDENTEKIKQSVEKAVAVVEKARADLK
ncbi:hypothetical protein [Alysiella crassa]|uniref:Uncharacterized protein n=1 Tax=Alysiella crassa TaxID=153491 RepID=A0A376BNA9_9NEIS|nr:hypothetical protein [Alysiella crassa]UOP07137.1 hypothetical protein LVJ80_01345 [Alysiella crassa]SSY70704.1 Uncharacterised protein [Alysiella crassa]